MVLCNLQTMKHLIKKSSAVLRWGSLYQSEGPDGIHLVPILLSVTFDWWLEISRGRSIYTSEITDGHKSKLPATLEPDH